MSLLEYQKLYTKRLRKRWLIEKEKSFSWINGSMYTHILVLSLTLVREGEHLFRLSTHQKICHFWVDFYGIRTQFLYSVMDKLLFQYVWKHYNNCVIYLLSKIVSKANNMSYICTRVKVLNSGSTMRAY